MRKLQVMRSSKELTQKQLAELAGIPRAEIVRYEQPFCHEISEANAKKICKVLGTTPCILLAEDNLKFIPQTILECEYMIKVLEELKNEIEEKNREN